MARLQRGQFGRRIRALIEAGVEIKCGNCGRDMSTKYGVHYHLIYNDGSGRCFAPDGIWPYSESLTPMNSVSTRFGASLTWAENTVKAQKQALSHGETGTNSIGREENP